MEFDPSRLLARDSRNDPSNSSLVILNQPIKNFQRLKAVWENTSYRVCADGGANALLDATSRQPKTGTSQHQTERQFLPDLIHGDLDSVTDATRQFYESRNVRVSQDEDQYRTDFAKCMLALTKDYKTTNRPDLDDLGPEQPSKTIVIMSTMSGRIDQAIGLLHELLRESLRHGPDTAKPTTIYFVSEQAVSFVLPVGRNVIRGIDPKKGIFRKHAGILPIYGPAKITIEGFEWDVQDWETMMGGNVSTSNHVLGGEVVVEVFEQSVLFTIELEEIESS